jgi:type I restriction enzyme, S subunit
MQNSKILKLNSKSIIIAGKYPDDWDFVPLGSEESGILSNGVNKDKEDYGYGTLFVNISDIFRGFNISPKELDRVFVSDKEIESYQLEKGDLVLDRSSTVFENVGYPAHFDGADEPVVFSGFTFRFRPNPKFWNQKYLAYQLRSYPIRKLVLSISTRSANTNVNRDAYKQILIPHPPINEQKEIGLVLSHIENKINKISEKIEFYEKMKKGILQKIMKNGLRENKKQKVDWHYKKEMTIPENWHTIPLGKLCKVRKECEIESNLYVGLEHIEKNTNRLSGKGNTIDFTSNKNSFIKGDVLYGKLRPRLNKIWLATESGFCSTDILPLIPNKKILSKMLLLILSYHYFYWYAIGHSAGTKMPRTNWTDMKKFLVFLPNDEEEQKEIVKIIVNIDNEISLLYSQKNENENLKKGLMQKLLTGEIRVKV